MQLISIKQSQMKKVLILILLMGRILSPEIKAQDIAVKSNLLYGFAAVTINAGMEIGLGQQWSLDLPINFNPWKINEKTRLRHWGIQPEIRYWFNEKFERTFIGFHAHYADFNVGNWSFFSQNMQDNRYQGHLYGAGFSIGHVWKLKERWLLETSLGLGYSQIVYEKYPCATCGTMIKDGNRNYWGPTKASVSLIYIIKQKEKDNKVQTVFTN